MTVWTVNIGGSLKWRRETDSRGVIMINDDDKLGFRTYKSETDTNLTIFTYS